MAICPSAGFVLAPLPVYPANSLNNPRRESQSMPMTHATLNAVSVSDDPVMARLEPVLREFNSLIESYCEVQREPPYWFTERATLSILAAAAWRCGWIAVEEYSTRKVLALRATADGEIHRHGRCDLYLRSGPLSFAIEAKQVVAGPVDLPGAITDGLRRARHDAMHLFATEATARVALLFVVPTFPTAESEIELDDAVGGALSEVVGRERRSTHAYVFPSAVRECIGPKGLAYWPGVMAIMQRIRRRASSRTSEAEQELDA